MTRRPTLCNILHAMHRVVQLIERGRTYTFTVELDGPFRYWRVQSSGRPARRTPCLVLGDEELAFFRMLAEYSDDPVNWSERG